jgi:hypothetical protein
MRLTKYVIYCCAVLIVALSSGCMSIPLEVNEGRISGAKTFSLMPSTSASPKLSGKSGEINIAIQSAIEAVMAKNGIKNIEKDGNLTIGYLIVIRNRVATRAIGEYFGQGTETEEIRNKMHRRADNLYEQIEKDRTLDAATITVAAIMIDVIDSKSMELRYRDFSARVLLDSQSKEQRAKRIEEAVNEALGKLKFSGR